MIDIEAIKARAAKAARKWASSDFYADSAEDVPDLLAALETSETSRVKAEQERDALKEALTAVRDDLQDRAVKNVVAVGISVWIQVNAALEQRDALRTATAAKAVAIVRGFERLWDSDPDGWGNAADAIADELEKELK